MAKDSERSLAALLAWTTPPGEGPFRVKGLAYRGHLAYVDKFVPGGNAAILAALPEHPALVPFFAQPFLAASRYDVVPLAMAGLGASRVTGLSFHQFVRTRSEWQARDDVSGVYRTMLNLASAEQVALRLPKLMAQYFDFGPVETERMDRGHVRATLRRVPLPLHAWLAAVVEGYLFEVFRVMGTRELRIARSPAVGHMLDAGIERVDLVTELRWRAD